MMLSSAAASLDRSEAEAETIEGYLIPVKVTTAADGKVIRMVTRFNVGEDFMMA